MSLRIQKNSVLYNKNTRDLYTSIYVPENTYQIQNKNDRTKIKSI